MKIAVAIIALTLAVALFLINKSEPSPKALKDAKHVIQLQQDKMESKSEYSKQTQAPVQIKNDLFTQAKMLLSKASEGDAASQFELAEIIQNCFFLNKYSTQILDDISMLRVPMEDGAQNYIDLVKKDVEDCYEFHSGTLSLFVPADFVDDKRSSDFMMTAMSWLLKSAESKHNPAINQLAFLAPEKLEELGLTDTFTHLVNSLDPDALFSLGGCLQSKYFHDDLMLYTAAGLQQAACTSVKHCTVNSQALFRNISLTHCLSLSETSSWNAEKESALQCYSNLDTKGLVNSHSTRMGTLPFPEETKVAATQFSDPKFINKLVIQCVGE